MPSGVANVVEICTVVVVVVGVVVVVLVGMVVVFTAVTAVVVAVGVDTVVVVATVLPGVVIPAKIRVQSVLMLAVVYDSIRAVNTFYALTEGTCCKKNTSDVN